jgi:preprotein translocase SecE subunit
VASKSKNTASIASSTITRVKAVDTTPIKRKSVKTTEKIVTEGTKSKRSAKSLFKPFIALGRYFKGSWFELRQVRWPDRKATWSLTVAVLLFTAFFIVLIVALDALFKFIFQQILG